MRIRRIIGTPGAIVLGLAVLSATLCPTLLALSPPAPAVAHLVALSPDGQIVAASGYGMGDGIKVWNVQRGFSYFTVPAHGWRQLSFLPDSRYLQAINETDIQRWDATKGTPEPAQTGGIGPFNTSAVSPDGNQLAQIAQSRSNLSGYDLKLQSPGKDSLLISNFSTSSALGFSLDGRLLANVGKMQQAAELPNQWSEDSFLRVIDTRTGDILQSTSVGPLDSPQLSFSSDGQQIAVAASHGKVTLFDTATVREVKSFEIPPTDSRNPDRMRFNFFSKDGKILVSATDIIQLWDVEKGTLQTTLNFPVTRSPIARSVAFSADKKTLAVGVEAAYYENKNTEPLVYIWNVESGQFITSFN